MALTSLEAISEKLNDIRKETIESILMVSGSSAITKNEYGVTIVENLNPVSSLVFKNLSKPKYDEAELIKAIDVGVKELMPNIPTPNLDLVPRPLYTEQVLLVEDLRKQVQRLTIIVTDLNSQITTLQAQVQTEINNRLTIEQTNDVLTNQIDTLTNTISDFTGQISTSLQKSVDESILRASLQSQNTGFKAQINALIKQIDSLNAIIEGLQSQLGAVQQQEVLQNSSKSLASASGAEIVHDVALVKFIEKGNEKEGYFLGAISTGKNGRLMYKYGETMEILNNDKFPIQVKLEYRYDSQGPFLLTPQKDFEIAAGATKSIKHIMNKASLTPVPSRDAHSSGAHPGNLKVSVTRKDGSIKSKDFKIVVNIMHWDSMPGW
jgi:hypothetical protein